MKYFISFLLLLSTSTLYSADLDIPFKNCASLTSTLSSGSCITSTAFFIKEDKTKYIMLSSAHGVRDCCSLHINLFFNSKRSSNITAKLVKKNESVDISMLEVDKKDVDKYGKPVILPLAPIDYKPDIGDIIVTAGFPATNDDYGHRYGTWCSCITGMCSHNEYEDYFYIKPGFIPGRSGSAILDKDCTMIIGILLLQDGGCCLIDRVHNFINTQ